MAYKPHSASQQKKLDELLEITKQRGLIRHADTEQKKADTPRQMFLPDLDEIMRAMPSHIARPSLFWVKGF